MKHVSIFYRFLLYFSVFSIFLILLIWIAQSLVLPDYYYKQQVKNVYKEMDLLDLYIDNESMTQQTTTLVNQYQATITSKILIYQKNGVLVYGPQGTENLRQEDLVLLTSGNYERIIYDGAMNYLYLTKSFETYIYRFVIPYQSLRITTSITNQFFLIAILVSMFLSLMIAYIISKSVSNPLVSLSLIAEKMSNLDLSISYQEDRRDEIGKLGTALNKMSQELKSTILKLQIELKKEKELEEMRKKFISLVSHELQTPIAIILGTLEALEDNIAQTPEEKQHYFQMIKIESAKMSRLAKDMLELSHLESGLFKLELNEVNYREFIDSIILKMKHLYKDSLLNISLDYISHIEMVYIDEIKMEQVISNMLLNVFLHSKHASQIVIEITHDETYLITKIKNDGALIKDEDIAYLFDRFYKGKDSKKGTGLGLAIVKEIMMLHKGIYSVKNEAGWVVFSIGIPLK